MDAFGGLIWSLARRFSASAADAEDATQEIFLEVWRSAARYDRAMGSEAVFITIIAESVSPILPTCGSTSALPVA